MIQQRSLSPVLVKQVVLTPPKTTIITSTTSKMSPLTTKKMPQFLQQVSPANVNSFNNTVIKTYSPCNQNSTLNRSNEDSILTNIDMLKVQQEKKEVERINHRLQKEIEFWKEQSMKQLRGRQQSRDIELKIMLSEQEALKRQLNQSLSENNQLLHKCSQLEYDNLENMDKTLMLSNYHSKLENMERDIVQQKEQIVSQETESYQLRKELNHMHNILDEKHQQINNWKNMYNNLLQVVEQQRGNQVNATIWQRKADTAESERNVLEKKIETMQKLLQMKNEQLAQTKQHLEDTEHSKRELLITKSQLEARYQGELNHSRCKEEILQKQIQMQERTHSSSMEKIQRTYSQEKEKLNTSISQLTKMLENKRNEANQMKAAQYQQQIKISQVERENRLKEQQIQIQKSIQEQQTKRLQNEIQIKDKIYNDSLERARADHMKDKDSMSKSIDNLLYVVECNKKELNDSKQQIKYYQVKDMVEKSQNLDNVKNAMNASKCSELTFRCNSNATILSKSSVRPINIQQIQIQPKAPIIQEIRYTTPIRRNFPTQSNIVYIPSINQRVMQTVRVIPQNTIIQSNATQIKNLQNL